MWWYSDSTRLQLLGNSKSHRNWSWQLHPLACCGSPCKWLGASQCELSHSSWYKTCYSRSPGASQPSSLSRSGSHLQISHPLTERCSETSSLHPKKWTEVLQKHSLKEHTLLFLERRGNHKHLLMVLATSLNALQENTQTLTAEHVCVRQIYMCTPILSISANKRGQNWNMTDPWTFWATSNTSGDLQLKLSQKRREA